MPLFTYRYTDVQYKQAICTHRHIHEQTNKYIHDKNSIDKDRTENGDYYKKPTQYWFINCKPKYNLVFEPLEYVETRRIDYVNGSDRKTQRSLIHPQYASRFIKQYLV